jgi:AraC-like DNA-binding protein
MHHFLTHNVPVGFAAAVHGLRDSVRDRVAALGWLDFDAGQGATHANLASDLFIVTLQVADTAAGIDGLGPHLHVVITPVSQQPRQYRVAGHSQIAVATLTVGGMLSLFKTDLLGLTDRPVPLAELCGEARTRALWMALQGCHSVSACVAAFGRWLEAGLLEAGPLSAADGRVARSALRLSSTSLTGYDAQALARLEGVTRRQLERDFRQRLGLSPGAFARVARFQRAAAAVASGAAIADSALEHGYADQAHLNRAFKAYSGMTPRALALQGARPGRELLRAGLAGRVILLDVPTASAAGVPIRRVDALARATHHVAQVQDPLHLVMAKWAA